MHRMIPLFLVLALPLQAWAMVANWSALDTELGERMEELTLEAAWQARDVMDADMLRRADVRHEMLALSDYFHVQYLGLAAITHYEDQETALRATVSLLLRGPDALEIYGPLYLSLEEVEVDLAPIIMSELDPWISYSRLVLLMAFLPAGTAERMLHSEHFSRLRATHRALILEFYIEETSDDLKLPEDLRSHMDELRCVPGVPAQIALFYGNPDDWSDESLRAILTDPVVDRMFLAVMLSRHGAHIFPRITVESLDLSEEMQELWLDMKKRIEQRSDFAE
ncbi:MAG: hypothetical protein EA401_07100 [Planctomycetota bacterium]|nr:MAG: hypothetical protein EA401_07100 [Planctomycetota bacterium]